VFLLGWFLSAALFAALAPRGPNPFAVERLFGIFSISWFLIAVMLAGAGIKTQAALVATKGLHGSMYVTLSLPVSRFRLLAVRAGLGFLETIGIIAVLCCGLWVALPGLKMRVSPSNTLEYFAAIVFCVSAFYFLGVLLAVFLDDIWQFMSSMFAVIFLQLVAARLPPFLNVFRAVGDSSPLFTHTLPWVSMGISLTVAAILFLVALKVVQAREY
jgi:hypothetical protein